MIELRLPARGRPRPDDPDPEAVSLVQESRLRFRSRLARRDLVASLVVGGGFLAAAVPLALLQQSHRSPDASTAVALLVGYAIAFRVEFEIAQGIVVPTELVLVPMLFLLPVGIVPLAVAGGILLGRLPDYLLGRAPVERAAVQLVGSWHAVGPALVLAIAGERGPALSDWDLYLAALAAQFGVDLVAGTLYELGAHGISARRELRFAAVGFGVDAALAPIGLLAALALGTTPYAFLLVLPLVALLAVFAANGVGRSTARRRSAPPTAAPPSCSGTSWSRATPTRVPTAARSSSSCSRSPTSWESTRGAGATPSSRHSSTTSARCGSPAS